MGSIYVDCGIAGISGDMIMSALFNILENPFDKLEVLNHLLNDLLMIDPILSIREKHQDPFSGFQLEIKNEINLSVIDIREALNKAKVSISPKYLKIANDAFEILVTCETNIHGESIPQLHELGSSDTVVDLIGVSFLLQSLGVTQFSHSSVILGSGSVKTQHGLLPVPAPVSLEIVQDYSIQEKISNLEGEAATPTGLAILAALKNNLESPKEVNWEKNGVGFGKKEWKDRSNILRVRYGKGVEAKQVISMLETNIDDLSGEHLGGIVSTLMENGALDVNYFPIFMKKNRPGYCLRVLTNNSLEDRLVEIIMKYTGTLGLRVYQIDRHIGGREFQTKLIKITLNQTEIEMEVPIKVGKFRKKIEYEFLQNISKEYNLSPLQLENLIWKELYKKEEE